MLCKSFQMYQRRVGSSLKQMPCKRHLVPSRKQVAYQLPISQGSLSSLKRVPRPLHAKIVLVETDNTTVVSYINKEGDMRSGLLCALKWRILTWYTRNQVTFKARHIPGRLSVVADKLSRLGQTIQIEWSLLQEVFQAICSRCHWPQIDLFTTRFNAVDALSLPWEDLDAYTFPPSAILGKVVEKL